MIKCINSLEYWHRPSDIITHTIFGISHHFDANIVWRLFLIWPFDESSVWKHGKLKCFPCIQSRLKPTESLDDRVNDPRDLHKRRKSQKYHWNLPAFQSCIFSNRIANHSMPSFEYEVNGIAELSRRIPKEYYQSAFISAFGQHLIQSLFFFSTRYRNSNVMILSTESCWYDFQTVWFWISHYHTVWMSWNFFSYVLSSSLSSMNTTRAAHSMLENFYLFECH